MPLGIKSPLISPTGKPDLGCLGTAPSYSFNARRQKGLQVTAAAVRPWPWRSMGSNMTISSLMEGVKLPPSPFAPHNSGQSAKQADPGSTRNAVDLQEGSTPSVASALESNEAAAKAFRVQSPQQVQDVFNCLVLAETVYKVQEGNHAEVASTVAALRQDFPAPLVTLQRLQWSLPHVPHRYLLAESEEALYVAFIGTKQGRDIVTNANIMQQPLWPDLPHAMPSAAPQDVPAAHTGFLTRARGVAIRSLYQQASHSNKRLVLTGHSLGGAVALLCTLDLLHGLGDGANPRLACVGFATPAVGNAALADYAKAKGWDSFITNYLVPEDVIARLIPPQLAAPAAQSADQAANPDQASGPAHPALWASLAQQQQPPSCPNPPPTSPNLSAPSHRGDCVQQPSAPFCTMSLSLDDVGQMQEAAPFGCPSLPPRFKTADGSLCARQGSALGSSKQLAQLSATAVRKPPSTFSAVGFDRHSMPTLHSNIVPLQGLGRGHNGSKRLYNSLSDNSRRAASAQLDSQKAACSVCNITAQGHGSGSSTGLLHGDSQQHQQQQQQQQQHAAPSAPSTGLWTQTSRLARLVSFPVRVTRAYYSYVPLGQQLYLNPQSVTTSIQDLGQSLASNGYLPSAAAAAEAASPPSTLPAAILSASKQQPATASVSDGVSEVVDSVVLQRREQLGRLWMHRMPTYRARFQQILFGALGEALPLALPTHGPQASRFHGDSGRQGRPIAPHIRVRRAEACAGSLLASHHLTDMLKGGVSAVAEQSSFRWFWMWSGAWPAIRSRLLQKQQDITLQIAVRGQGIQHVNSTQATFENESLTSRIVKQPHSMGDGMSIPAGNQGSNLIQAVSAMLLSSKPTRELVVEVVVPARLSQKAQAQLASTGGLQLDVTVQSDFCSACAPVTFQRDPQALQDSLTWIVAVCRIITAMLLRTSYSSGQVAR